MTHMYFSARAESRISDIVRPSPS